MRKSFIVGLVVAAGLVGVIATSHAQASDPWIGSWKVNLARSTYSPGPTPKVAATIKIESAPGGIKTTIDGANAQGQPTHTENVAAFDGKDSPVKGAAVPNTTTALKRIDGRTFEAQGKVGGKPTVMTRVTISADGKTLTATQSGQDAQGQAVKNVIVADRQ
ncbi:MAG: hypothetical protein ACRD3C_19525 [Vicinamibacterales bacterium]